jgi:hypothetical protein
MRIRIQLLLKVIGICDHWSIEPLGLYLSLQESIVSVHSPPRLCFEPLKLLNFDSNAYPDLAFHQVLGIRIRMFSGPPDPDPLVRVTDPALAPDPSLFSLMC